MARNSRRARVAEGRRGSGVARKPFMIAGTVRSGRFEGRSSRAVQALHPVEEPSRKNVQQAKTHEPTKRLSVDVPVSVHRTSRQRVARKRRGLLPR